METVVNQRWRDRRDSYRPAGEVIDTRAHEVAAISSDNVAREFVERHHYSACYPAAQHRYGLYRGGDLVGVAVFSVPSNDKVLTNVFAGANPREFTELGRFVLLDHVAGNGETWFLARAFEQLRAEGVRGVVSFSDPVARTAADGRRVFGGHVGTIYQAHNASYLGLATPRSLSLLPDGSVFSDRAKQKIRKLERGWRYAVAALEAAGAEPLGDAEPREWLTAQLARVVRTARHRGNHKYAWAFDKQGRKSLPASKPYPKFHAAEAA